MTRRSGRAFIFLRWSGSSAIPMRLGDVGWAFEYNDRLGRFNYFLCGATELSAKTSEAPARSSWQEKCFTLPQLVKAMSHQAADRPGFDEVKVFEVEQTDPEAALQWAAQQASSADESRSSVDPLIEAREVLMRYGVRGLADAKSFSAPFLWYNMLRGRSVPLRKLPVHLFQLRMSGHNGSEALSSADVEDIARKAAHGVLASEDLGEFFVTRSGLGFLVALTISVDGRMPVRDGHAIADRVEEAIRNSAPVVRHVFVHVEPED